MNRLFYLASIVIGFGCLFPFAQAQVSPGSNSYNFNYVTGVMNSSNLTTLPVQSAFNSLNPPKWYSMNVTTQATGFMVKLEGSLDNQNWQQIAITNSVLGSVSNTTPIPSLYLRMRATTLSAGTSVTGTAIGVW